MATARNIDPQFTGSWSVTAYAIYVSGQIPGAPRILFRHIVKIKWDAWLSPEAAEQDPNLDLF